MDMLARGHALCVKEIARSSTSNPAYLHVALRCLAQQGWLSRSGTPGTGSLTYQLTCSRFFFGEVFSKHFEMRPTASLEAILVPSNQAVLVCPGAIEPHQD